MMSDDSPGKIPPRNANELAEDRTDMAFQRTVMAADRTLMAWIRTSLSMISFGFTIFKFFQYIHELKTAEPVIGSHGARNLGMLMTILGTVLLMLATAEHALFLRRICREMHQKFPRSLSLLAALLLSIIGLLALMDILFHVGPL
jgi:putative membrane protein